MYNRKVLVELDEEKRLENMFDDDHYFVPVLFIKRLLLKFIIGSVSYTHLTLPTKA